MMATDHDLQLDTASGVRAYLEGTPFASDSVTPLVGGYGNFTYRLWLKSPYENRKTVVVKYGRSLVLTRVNASPLPLAIERQNFEVEALRRVSEWLPAQSVVQVPRIYLFDKENHFIIMEDCGGDVVTLKKLTMETPPRPVVAEAIGKALGEFLARLHDWGTVSKDLLDYFDAHEQGKQISAFLTYGRLVTTITGQDSLPMLPNGTLSASEGNVGVVTKLAEERTRIILSSHETFTMGDFWTGNILVRLGGEGDAQYLEQLYVVDWELAKPGLAGFDVGQFCAEMHLLRRFNDSDAAQDAASRTLSAFLSAYHSVRPTDVDLARTAIIHAGAHLVAWTPRIPWGDEPRTREVVAEGLELLLDGYQGPESSLKGSILGGLLQ
ncbi:hypothetical protein JAAARDRAFT_188771 [Jaapia argillacea MUCL 33604]|uniref:Aminoglycoside phosphotransferase domain-containing protein n=1 Tax=Jaapia argillacea MUCL 33604 TaxID=933084 RepID=A0A067QAF8_9AGAM|nr:hypothetical protein JAAARDRAFT_188771 [Jaapia argillacea MUCL 33604]